MKSISLMTTQLSVVTGGFTCISWRTSTSFSASACSI